MGDVGRVATLARNGVSRGPLERLGKLL